MRVTMMLCDSCQAVNGKLYILGGGWSITGPDPVPFGIAILFEVPWDQANDRHTFRLELLDADGQPVLVETAEGEQPLFVEGGFETGRPPGLLRGTPLDFPVAFNSAPQPLESGRYQWLLEVDGETDEDWRLAFWVRPSA